MKTALAIIIGVTIGMGAAWLAVNYSPSSALYVCEIAAQSVLDEVIP